MARNDPLKQLHQGLIEMNLPLNIQMEAQLIRYIGLIAQNNLLFNLSPIRDIDTMVTRHLLESLSLVPYLKGQVILDLGTGAGLPGIPLAIALPHCHFVLLDSNLKKIRFLRQVCDYVHLPNVRLIHRRAEEYQTTLLFDSIISRAFATLREILHLGQHWIKPGGQFLTLKGVYPLTELQEISAHCKRIDIYPIKIPNLNAERHIISFQYEPKVQHIKCTSS